jgi:hypothetical protein
LGQDDLYFFNGNLFLLSTLHGFRAIILSQNHPVLLSVLRSRAIILPLNHLALLSSLRFRAIILPLNHLARNYSAFSRSVSRLTRS